MREFKVGDRIHEGPEKQFIGTVIKIDEHGPWCKDWVDLRTGKPTLSSGYANMAILATPEINEQKLRKMLQSTK